MVVRELSICADAQRRRPFDGIAELAAGDVGCRRGIVGKSRNESSKGVTNPIH